MRGFAVFTSCVSLIRAQPDDGCQGEGGGCKDGRFPDYESCNQYYTCLELFGSCFALNHACPRDAEWDEIWYEYDPVTQECWHPGEVNCTWVDEPDPTPGPPPENGAAAFSAFNTEGVLGDTMVVELFSEEQVGDGFSNAHFRYFPQNDGLHYFTFTGGAMANYPMELVFATEDGELQYPLVRRLYNMDGHKVMSRDLLTWANASSDIYHLYTETPVYSSELSKSLAMDGFDVEAVVGDEPIAFAAYSEYSHFIAGSTIPIEAEYIDTCDCYDEETYRFRAPKEGIYHLSFSVGTPGYQLTQARLMRSRPDRDTVTCFDYNHDMDGTDTLSRSILLYMVQGEEAWLELWAGVTYSSAVGMEVTFGGWGYFPATFDPQAWSVHSEMSWTSQGDDDWLDPVPFELDGADSESDYRDLPVNTGIWDTDLDTVVAETSGFYLYAVNFGKVGSERLEIFVQRNNDTVAKLVSLSEDLLLNHMTSRSQIVHLYAGDILYLVAAPNSAYYSEEGNVAVSFSGMLLFPDEEEDW